MTTITRIRTDYDARLHVEVDTDAKVDCFLVALPPYTAAPLLIYREGADMNALWSDALACVAHLRAQPWKEIHPPHVFQPFGVITARNREDVRREMELRMSMLTGQQHPEHTERVRGLCRAWDVLDGAPLPVAVPWPDFKGLH